MNSLNCSSKCDVTISTCSSHVVFLGVCPLGAHKTYPKTHNLGLVCSLAVECAFIDRRPVSVIVPCHSADLQVFSRQIE